MAQQRIRKARRIVADKRDQEPQEGRQEVREDIRRIWWPEGDR
jgi:hypothetical protein